MSGFRPPSSHTSVMPFGNHLLGAKVISMRDFFGYAIDTGPSPKVSAFTFTGSPSSSAQNAGSALCTAMSPIAPQP